MTNPPPLPPRSLRSHYSGCGVRATYLSSPAPVPSHMAAMTLPPPPPPHPTSLCLHHTHLSSPGPSPVTELSRPAAPLLAAAAAAAAARLRLTTRPATMATSATPPKATHSAMMRGQGWKSWAELWRGSASRKWPSQGARANQAVSRSACSEAAGGTLSQVVVRCVWS
jgi:hypothetical protein